MYWSPVICADWQGDWRYSVEFDLWIVSSLSEVIKNSQDHAVSQQMGGGIDK